MGVFCEDDADEIQRRQVAINEHLEIGFEDLERVQWCSRVGDSNALMEWERHEGEGQPTELFQQIHNWAQDFGAQLIVLDSLHDLFPGNENSRPHARQFIQLLSSLARDCDGAVVLTAHPSLSGRSSGTGESGSTAWNNAVRSRVYLTKPRDDQGDEDDSDLRVLQRRKANYASTGDEIRLTWRDGVFATPSTNGGIVGAIEANIAESVFLGLLGKREAEGRPVSHKSKAGNYAPKEFAKHPGRQGYDKRAFGRAMEGLFASGSITVVEYGRPSDVREKIVPTSEGAE
jgi:RecA-family ATPase